MIKFCDYSKKNQNFKKDMIKEIYTLFNKTNEYELEKCTQELEKKFARYNNSTFSIGVNSGTTALQLALLVSGIKKNNKVIIPTYTYIATALAVLNIGAIPIFADIKEDLTIDENKIENLITKETKAIIPVHLHGNVCEMDKINKICEKYNLTLIEDCSQAHGAEYKGEKVGSKNIGCFSMHSSKIISGLGSSGIITMNNKEKYEQIKECLLPNSNKTNNIISKRTPCKMDAIQAAIIKIKLENVEKIIERKINIAQKYKENISNNKIKLIETNLKNKNVYRDICIKIDNPDKFISYMKENDIEVKQLYAPLHLTKFFKTNKNKTLSISEELCKKIVCLPNYYGITDEEIVYICEKINEYKL